MDNFTPTYQTTSFKKDEGGAIIYIALASIGAIVVLLGALYFMFFNNGNQNVENIAQGNEVVVSSNQDEQKQQQQIVPTSTPSVTSTPTVTATATPSVTPTESSEESQEQYDSNYVYGAFETSQYKLNEDKTQIVKTSTGEAVYTAPSGYSLVSFAVDKPSIFVVLKTPEAYTYEFRKVPYGSNSLGGLFYKYYSAYSMTSFVVNPKNYRTTNTYLILTSVSRKQFLVLNIKEFKEVGKKVVGAPSLDEFKAAYKLADQNAIKIEYTKSSGDTGTLLVSFED